MMQLSRDPVSPRWSHYHSLIVLIALDTLVEAVLFTGDAGILDIPRLRETAYEFGGFWPGLLRGWRPNFLLQPYVMFVTYAFLHAGLLHLIFNMVTLWSLGRVVLERVGQSGFLLLYWISVIGGAAGFSLLSASVQPMVGASGGLFGLAGGILAWSYVDRYAAAQRLWPVFQGVMLLLFLNVIMWWLMDGLLAWQAHLGGFIAGWVSALLIDPTNSQIED